jgi:predicted phosphodiesterase
VKIALLSDAHLEFYRQMHAHKWLHDRGRIDLWCGFTLPAEVDADVFVIAGDIHPDERIRDGFVDRVRKLYGKPTLHVTGNHDFYHGTFPYMEKPRVVEVDGVRFALATLWTQPLENADQWKNGMNDFRLIEFATALPRSDYLASIGLDPNRRFSRSIEEWEDTHRYHADYLFEVDADVTVTHHLPSYRSIPTKFAGNPLNQFYATCLDDRIEAMKNCRLWIHGHTHDAQDYHVKDVRIVCWPIGYPNETERSRLPEWKIVELNV